MTAGSPRKRLSPHDQRAGNQIVQAAFAGCERDHQKADTEHERGEELREITTESPPERNSLPACLGDSQTADLLAERPLPR